MIIIVTMIMNIGIKFGDNIISAYEAERSLIDCKEYAILYVLKLRRG